MAYSLILSTTASKEEAQNIARTLVEKRLVACVNIVGPIESIYRWRGEVEDSQEYLLLMKTEAERFESVREAVKALHPYEVPELIQIPIQDGMPAYLQWITESLKNT